MNQTAQGNLHTPLIAVSPALPSPVYRQVADEIRTAVLAGSLKPGEALPAPEELAESLVLSPSVVRRAYLELINAGICLESDDGSIRVARVPSRVSSSPDPDQSGDLSAARDIQLRLMSPSRIEGDGFVAAARHGAAKVVGGDFYHVSDRAGTVDIIVGDVAGKGVTAGLVAASVESSAPLLGRNLSLDRAMRALNDRLASLLGSRRFVAMAWARYHRARGVVELANAGLPDPYLITPAGELTAISVPGTRLPLGSRRDLTWETSTVPFPAGSRLLMITDGLTEAMAEDGEPLGCDRLEELLRRQSSVRGIDNERWLADLLARIDRHTGHRFDDDWTALLFRATGTAQSDVRPDRSGNTNQMER
jgi:hypothetical protein